MGFLGGLFEKKNCDVCGNKIGLLGNRKLQDGNLCKDCAKKLSPWFSERKNSTVAEIMQQLSYREQNRQAVSAFHTTRSIGKYYKVLLDEDAGRFMVTDASRIEEANPDVVEFSQVTGCDLEVKEDRNELKQKGSDGKQVSYNPPRYEYYYNFYVTIRVNHPYFDEMRFRLNAGAVKTGERSMAGLGNNWQVSTNAGIGLFNNGVNEYYDYINMGNEIKEAMEQARLGARTGSAGGSAAASGSASQGGKMTTEQFLALSPEEQQAYYKKSLEEAIRMAEQQGIEVPPSLAASVGAAGAAGTAEAAASAQMAAPSQVKCPWCGAMTPAGAKCAFCEGELS